MSFWDSIQETINEGLAASKILVSNTAQTVKELGQEGALRFEILQLRNQAEKLSAKLGARVFQMLNEENVGSVTGKEESLAPLMEQIDAIKDKIEEKSEKIKKKE